jgi:integrase
MAKTLTALTVKNHRAGKERREIRDGGCPGLYLVVQAVSGHKSWAMRFRRPDGRPAKLTLGSVYAKDKQDKTPDPEPVIGGHLTLAAARALAAEVNRRRAMGIDVVADRDADRRRRRSEHETRARSTFAAAARDFVEGHAMKKTRRWKETARLLGLRPMPDGLGLIPKGLAERWADRPVAAIDGHDVYDVIEEVRLRGVPGLRRLTDGPSESMALSMLSCLSKLFSWLAQHRRVEKNPAAGVHRPGASRPRDRVLSDAEIVAFWQATEGERFSAVLRLLLLTGCRLNEVAGMTRAELSDDGATWHIPGERTKNHRPHVVPLAPPAREILAGVAGEGSLVFTTNGRSPVSGFAKIKKRLDEHMRVPPWRIHDLRRTAATGMAEIGIAPHIVEAALNHISGAKAGVAGTYNRAAYAPEKKTALERWAAHIEGLVSGQAATVTSLRRR